MRNAIIGITAMALAFVGGMALQRQHDKENHDLVYGELCEEIDKSATYWQQLQEAKEELAAVESGRVIYVTPNTPITITTNQWYRTEPRPNGIAIFCVTNAPRPAAVTGLRVMPPPSAMSLDGSVSNFDQLWSSPGRFKHWGTNGGGKAAAK